MEILLCNQSLETDVQAPCSTTVNITVMDNLLHASFHLCVSVPGRKIPRKLPSQDLESFQVLFFPISKLSTKIDIPRISLDGAHLKCSALPGTGQVFYKA